MKDKIEQFILNWGKPALAATHESFKSELDSLLKEVAEDTIRKCKAELLKQTFVMKHENDYPSEAVPKATILMLDKLVTNKPQP